MTDRPTVRVLLDTREIARMSGRPEFVQSPKKLARLLERAGIRPIRFGKKGKVYWSWHEVEALIPAFTAHLLEEAKKQGRAEEFAEAFRRARAKDREDEEAA